MNQKRTVMGACEYSLETFRSMKKTLSNLDNADNDMTWAVAGLITCLTSKLLQICEEVIQEMSQNDKPSAKQDLITIKARFNEFIDDMISYE
jgi:hypothetical protein